MNGIRQHQPQKRHGHVKPKILDFEAKEPEKKSVLNWSTHANDAIHPNACRTLFLWILRPRNYSSHAAGTTHPNTWVVVKIMVPFWGPIIIRHLLFRVSQKGRLILTTTYMEEAHSEAKEPQKA